MPNDIPTYSKLPRVARGYIDCIVAAGGLRYVPVELQDIDRRNLPVSTLQAIAEDCASFLAAAEALHPDGKAGLRRAINHHDLGWHFFLARQGTGIGYQNFMLGDFGEQLTELAVSYGSVVVQIRESREIPF